MKLTVISLRSLLAVLVVTLTIVLSGPQPLTDLQQIAEDTLQKQFNAVTSVSAASIQSGITREVHVKVDQSTLRARGLAINSVITAVQPQQLEVPSGTIHEGSSDFSVYFDSLARTSSQLGDLIVVQTGAGPVYLRDVAKIEETKKDRRAIVRVSGREGLAIAVSKLADANTTSVVDGVKETTERLQPELPAGAEGRFANEVGRTDRPQLGQHQIRRGATPDETR